MKVRLVVPQARHCWRKRRNKEFELCGCLFHRLAGRCRSEGAFLFLLGGTTNMAVLRAFEKQGQIFYSKRRGSGVPFCKLRIRKLWCGRKRCRGCALPPQSRTSWAVELRLGVIRRHAFSCLRGEGEGIRRGGGGWGVGRVRFRYCERWTATRFQG